ncbi:unnamed protein product [Effrenium voratum]|uniref:Uncharacterized protein n=1 Tax=Effrenium voratum TaxID=2562239 RepID=A0AA36JPZ8_9DINO|nr:unnamed protein product [Effrenium voratum]
MVGDLLNISFDLGVRGDQWYGLVLLAQLRGEAQAALGLVLRCGNQALESSALPVKEADGSALQLRSGSAATLELMATDPWQLKLTGLSVGVQQLRVIFLPAFGPLSWAESQTVAAQYWSNAEGSGSPAASRTLSGARHVLSEYPDLPATVLDVVLPSAWSQLRSVQLSFALSSAASPATSGFAGHSYVYVEARGTSHADFARLQSGGSQLALAPPSLALANLAPTSFMGGAAQRVDLLLQFGFVARGATLTVTAPAEILITGHSATPGAAVHSVLAAQRSPLPELVGEFNGNTATLTVSSSKVLWQAATYTHSLIVQNPYSMASGITWSVTVAFASSLPETGDTMQVQKDILLEDGAFATVPALETCSLTPLSMRLGAEQRVQVLFVMPSLDVTSSIQPFALRVVSPSTFGFLAPADFRPMRNLPPAPASNCLVTAPQMLLCVLPTGFLFRPGLEYGFEVAVINPPSLEVALNGWALRLESSDAQPLRSTCEDIPQSPTDTKSFALYSSEMDKRLFSVSFAGVPRPSSSTAVVVVFQSSRLPTNTWLTIRAPPHWVWQPAGLEGRSAILLRGTTHDLPLPTDTHQVVANASALSAQLTAALESGRVYGLQAEILLPTLPSTSTIWSVELRGSAPEESALVSEANYEAVVDEFSNLRVPVVSGCTAVPSSLLSGTTEVFVSFSLVSALPGEIQVLLPPGFLGEEPCEDSLAAVPLPPGIEASGYVYPAFTSLPTNTSCSWNTTGGRAVLKIQGGSVGAVSHLIAVKVSIPPVDQELMNNNWEIGTFRASGEPLDAACVMTTPFRLVEQQVRNLSAQALQVLWTRDTHPIMVLGFVLSAQAAPARLAVLAPLGLWTLGACRVLQDVPAGYSSFTASTCIAGGGGPTGLFPRPGALLEGVIEIETGTLDAGTPYAFGIEFNLPTGHLRQNRWFLAVENQVAEFEGLDLLRFETVEVLASFQGLAMNGPLPYNDVKISFTLAANATARASLVVAIPQIFVASVQAIVCFPFRSFSGRPQGDSCMLVNSSLPACQNATCVQAAPTDVDATDWLVKDVSYVLEFRLQNPSTCEICQPPWQVFLLQDGVLWSAESEGFPLVGDVQAFTVEPSHLLGDSEVLLTLRVAFAGRLLLYDKVVLTVPQGWQLDPSFCSSPVAQAALTGLKAPPQCTQQQAILTVYEMDLPPLTRPEIQLRLEGAAPVFTSWQEQRTQWLSLPNTEASSLPVEFSVEVQRGSSQATVAAGKLQAYDVMPNMAPRCDLSISTALLASSAAMRLSFRPSESIDAYVNSVWIRSSLPYDFQGCSLLWEEPAARKALRPEDSAFAFAGEPRCSGQLNELTLFGVLLDTSIKDQVTLCVANFTVPRPPYAAKESRWQVALQRSRSGLAPDILDYAIGLPGPGAVGGIQIDAETFVSNLQAGGLNTLHFKLMVTVPLLQDSVIRVILPPGFVTEQTNFFQGVSRHFAAIAAASAVLRTNVDMTEIHGSSAPAGMVEILMLRVLVDSVEGESLDFKITVRNPAEELVARSYNRWLVETLDATSGLVVNSNRMSGACGVHQNLFGAKQKKLGFTEVEQAPQSSKEQEATTRSSAADRALAAATSDESRAACAAYLAAFGLLADGSALWSPKHLARAKSEAQPMLEIVIRGHEELGSHTWYVMDCAVWRPCLEFARSEWRCYRRLAHLRQGLHDPIKELLGTAYSKHFGDSPFASHGAPLGTTARLRSWCQTLCRCINCCDLPPATAAIALHLLGAPVKDSAMIALARSCEEDDAREMDDDVMPQALA